MLLCRNVGEWSAVMVRRTKEDAMATREAILDAAELLFVKQGVAHTTLQHIATAAGVTRGAIYWHFDDKGAMFNAMMERAKLPLDSAFNLFDSAEGGDALDDLHAHMCCVFDLTMNDPQARRVFEIATLKLEFVDEMQAVRDRRADSYRQWMARAEGRLRYGIAQGQIRKEVEPPVVALGLWALMDGLIRSWMFAPGSFDLVAMGRQLVAAQLDCLRASAA
jgi:TetR/AcrR family acrAB operon transcriptional repressor